MKLYHYTLLFMAMVGFALQSDAQPIHKPYNPWWQWGRSDTALSFGVPGSTVLAVRNGKALWGRMQRIKRASPSGEPQGDWILSEYDSLGRLNLGINTTITGKVNLIEAKADAAGNWYVLGRWYDTATFSVNAPYVRNNPGTNVDADHFIARFDAGTLFPKWITTVGPFSNISSRSFVVGSNSLLLLADTVNGSLVRSINTTTGVSTTLFKQTGASTTSSIQVDAAGSIYIAGSCATGGMNFNGATEPATTDPHSYIVKYRANGSHVWHRWFRDVSCHNRKLSLFNNHTLYYSGGMSDSFTLGSLPLRPTTSSYDYVVARLDTSGNAIWARQLPATSGTNIIVPGAPYHAVVMPDTSLVMFTQGNGWIDWEDTLFSNFQTVYASALVSFGPDSRTRWVRDVYTDMVMNQHIATEGLAIWVSGYARSTSATIAMDTMRTRTALNRYSPFMARTRMIRPVPTSNPGVGIAEPFDNGLRVYPVPAGSVLNIEGLAAGTRIGLLDLNGRRVIDESAGSGSRIVLSVSGLPRGTYVLELQENDGSRTVRRIILQ